MGGPSDLMLAAACISQETLDEMERREKYALRESRRREEEYESLKSRVFNLQEAAELQRLGYKIRQCIGWELDE